MGYVLGGLGAFGWSGVRSVWKEVREGEMGKITEGKDKKTEMDMKGGKGKAEKKKGKKN